MKVRFDFTIDDLIDANERALVRSPSIRSMRVTGLFVTSAAGALIGAWLVPPTQPFRMAYIVSIALLFAAFFAWNQPRARKRALRRVFGERYGVGPHVCEVELSPDGLVTSQFGTQTKRSWTQVASVNDTPDAVEFVMRGLGTVVVRNRAFASPDDRRMFIESARGFVAPQSPLS